MQRRVYLASFVFSFGIALATYVNSSFIEKIHGKETTGLIFAVASAVTLILLEIMPSILRRSGDYLLYILLCFGALVSVLTLAYAKSSILLTLVFIVYLTLVPLINFTYDIFLERYANKKREGGLRGMYLTVTNAAWVFAPLVAGITLTSLGFKGLYTLIGIIFTLLLCVSIFLFRSFNDTTYAKRSLLKTFGILFKHRDITKISGLQFLLFFFYSWMVIFTPLYLYEVIGFSFRDIGIIFTIMLLPFVLLQYPLGRIADRKYGEREFLVLGFAIASVSTLSLVFYHGKNIFVFALILFMTRVGASIIEVMNETYFFSSITNKAADLVGVFRAMNPLAYIVGPLIAGVLIKFTSFGVLFITLSCLMALGMITSYYLHDTK